MSSVTWRLQRQQPARHHYGGAKDVDLTAGLLCSTHSFGHDNTVLVSLDEKLVVGLPKLVLFHTA